MKKFEPYNFDSFGELIQHCYSQGWYSKTHEFFSLKMIGGFEAFSHRATESWEYKFVLTSNEIFADSSNEQKILIMPKFEFEGSTVKEVCDLAMLKLKQIAETE